MPIEVLINTFSIFIGGIAGAAVGNKLRRIYHTCNRFPNDSSKNVSDCKYDPGYDIGDALELALDNVYFAACRLMNKAACLLAALFFIFYFYII